jgi:hypothetical protein
MKTAVEHFLDAIKDQIPLSNEHLEMIESYASQAKEMEKEQIVNAFEIGYDNGACVQEGNAIYHGSNYYNETFKSE